MDEDDMLSYGTDASSILEPENLHDFAIKNNPVKHVCQNPGDVGNEDLSADHRKSVNNPHDELSATEADFDHKRLPTQAITASRKHVISLQADSNKADKGSSLTLTGLKDLGTKARARLEEERMKRPEIQRLDVVPTTDPAKAKTTRKHSMFLTKVPRESKRAPKRKGDGTLKMTAKSKKNRVENYTSYVPDTLHLSLPPKESRSGTVRLHGLPKGCMVSHIRSFFAGLHPPRILVLLPNKAHMVEIDASNTPPSYARVYDKEGVRVLAQFPTTGAAVLASERSGESIRMESAGVKDNEDGMPYEAFTIGVTVLGKELADALRTLSVTAVPGAPVDDVLATVQKQVHPMVSKILWSVTSRNFGLAVDRTIRSANIVLSNSNSIDPTTLQGYQCMAEHYNTLVDLQDDLISRRPYPSVEVVETTTCDPAVELTTAASRLLLREMQQIEASLYRSRVEQGRVPVEASAMG